MFSGSPQLQCKTLKGTAELRCMCDLTMTNTEAFELSEIVPTSCLALATDALINTVKC